jgi:hypothetical protein
VSYPGSYFTTKIDTGATKSHPNQVTELWYAHLHQRHSGTDKSMDDDASVLSWGSISIALNSAKQNATFQHITGGRPQQDMFGVTTAQPDILSSQATDSFNCKNRTYTKQ